VVAEGEKDALQLTADGFLGTSCPGGAEKWRPEYTAELAGCPVVILPDNDAKGHAHAQQVAAAVQPVATWVKIVELPGLPEHGDYTDWRAAGHTPAELLDLIAATPPWEPPAQVRLKRERDEARATLSQVMAILKRPDLTPTERVIGAVTVCEQLSYQTRYPLTPDDPECSREARALLTQGYQLAPAQTTVAKEAGVSRGTVARVWKRLGEADPDTGEPGPLDRREASVRRRAVDTETGEIDDGWTKRTFLRLAGDGAAQAALSPLATVPVRAKEKQHGGPRPKPICPACGSDAHVRWRAIPVCDRHGLTLSVESPPAQETRRMYQPDTFGGSTPAVVEEEPTTSPEELQCANLIHSAPADLDVADDELLGLGSIHRVMEGALEEEDAPLDDPDTWAVWQPEAAPALVPLAGGAVPPRACFACGTARWWTRPTGGEVCATCHPPPLPLTAGGAE
jgi:hypothetical protein